MDPMDFSMDGADHDQPPPSAPRCQYSQHPPSSGSSFSSASRDAHHYDPIHNTESWYPANSYDAASQSRSRTLPSFGQWNPPHYAPSNAWQPYADEQGHARPRADAPSQQSAFMSMPNSSWVPDMSSFDSISFAHPLMYMRGEGTPAATLVSERTAPPAATPTPAQPTYPRMNSRPDPPSPSNPSQEAPRIVERARATAVTRPEQRVPPMPQPAQSFGAFDHPRSHTPDGFSAARRRAARGWDSEDDDDAAEDTESVGYHRHSQLFGEQDEDRAMAAIRGAMAAAKKIPSKEAIASLERVDMKDLKDADKVCTICYNDIGVENPDGVIEDPIRLPKCKHVFGEKCIKKWFQDSDTCPYCRDKLPSELSIKKSAALESLRAHRERFAALSAQYRTREHGFSQRPPTSEELTAVERNNLIRHTQEEYHYIMTGSQASESWTYASHNRVTSPETRRRQGRGRASLNRPMSVGSARVVSPSTPSTNPPNTSQRPHHGLMTSNTSNPPSQGTSSPGQVQRRSEGFSHGSSFPGRPTALATSLAEASSSLSRPAAEAPSLENLMHYSSYRDHAADPWYEASQQQWNNSGRASLPATGHLLAPMVNSRPLPTTFHEQHHIPDTFSGHPQTSMGGSNYPSGPGDGSQHDRSRRLQQRWSAQFLD